MAVAQARQPKPDPYRVIVALADARRRELLDALADGCGASAGGLAEVLRVSRQAVAQHLAVLEEACLVSRQRAGRRVLFTVRPDGLTAAARWLTSRASAWEAGQQAQEAPQLETLQLETLQKERPDQGKDTLL